MQRAGREDDEASALRATQRSFRYQLLFLLTVLGLVAMPLIPGVRGALGVDVRQMAWGIGVPYALSLAATLVFHRLGDASAAYRLAVVVEALALLSGPMVLVFLGGRGDSFLWLIYFTYAVVNARNARYRGVAQILVATPPVLLAIAFLTLRHDPAAAAFSIFAGVLGSLIFHAGLRSAKRLADAIADRERLLATLGEVRMRDERTRIARDLHDGLGAALAAVSWRAQQIRSELPDGETKDDLGAITERASQGIDELRSVVWALRTPSRPWGDLCEYVEARCRELCVGRVDLRFSAGESSVVVDGERSLHVVRIVQEAVRNAVRHAQPRTVEVTLEPGPPMVLRIGDDGLGIPAAVLAESAGGLSNLRRRAESLRGRIDVRTRPGSTRIEVVLPSHGEAAPGA